MNRAGVRGLLALIATVLSACSSTTTTAPPKSAAPPPVGYLDMPSAGTIVSGPTIEVSGWVLDSSDIQPFIKVSIDGQPIEATVLKRMDRQDVCIANPSIQHCSTSQPGFTFRLETHRFVDGSHTIRLEAANKEGSAFRIATQEFVIKKKTCLVLSVGEAGGVAHIGAIDALKDAGIRPDCVAGNSVGAVIAGLYASAPEAELKPRFQKLIGKYKEMALEQARGRPGLAALFSGVLAGGIGGTALGSTASIVTVEKIDRERFTGALDAVFEHVSIEALPVPFATWYQTLSGNGMGPYTTATKGPLAAAVSCSANNPLIFKQDIANATCLDPGTDRPARIPVDESCTTFRPARIIAMNVTAAPAFLGRQMNCDLQEIMIPANDVPQSAMQGEGPAFERAYMIGYQTTKKWLAKARLR